MMSLCLEIEKYKQWRTTRPIPAEYDGWWGGGDLSDGYGTGKRHLYSYRYRTLTR